MPKNKMRERVKSLESVNVALNGRITHFLQERKVLIEQVGRTQERIVALESENRRVCEERRRLVAELERLHDRTVYGSGAPPDKIFGGPKNGWEWKDAPPAQPVTITVRKGCTVLIKSE